jgi:hypothetical protein
VGSGELGAVRVGRRDQGVGALKVLQERGNVAEKHGGSGERERLGAQRTVVRNLRRLGRQGREERLIPRFMRIGWLLVAPDAQRSAGT